MRLILSSIFACLLFQCLVLGAEGVADIREKGIRALKESETDSRTIVEAARAFAKAADLYAKAGDEDKATEMNAFLYWCKKKMSLQDIEQFTKSGDAVTAEKLSTVEKLAPNPDDSQKWLYRAEKYAKENPNEHYLIAVRFFEVASRFVGTKESIAAQERSLKEQGLELSKLTPSNTIPLLDKQVNAAKVGKTVNLLALIDPAKDAVAGKWGFNGAVLVGEKNAEAARIEIPYQPPEEYDFRMVFMRIEGVDCVCQILYKSDRQFQWTMDGWTGTISGIQTIDGKTADNNETTFNGKLLTNGRWHTSIVQVRNNGITVFFDGKRIANLSKAYDTLAIHPMWKLRDTSVLGVGHYSNKVGFSIVELVEVTGTGKKTR